jgi:5-carboxymethyl-2-hydroxymuconate isomerase
LDHIRETGMKRPSAPLLFGKLPSSVTGPHTDIVINPAVTTRADWEVELAVIIGERMRSVPVVDALGGVFGYTVANDVSARDLQLGDGQWLRGKSLDTFCPLGPYIVSPDEIGDPQRLTLTTKVNGVLVQDSSTAEMLFSVGHLISFCSRHFTLHPGDVILTGTPWGCGEFAEPRRSLCDGDTVDVSVENIGNLRNTVRFITPEIAR